MALDSTATALLISNKYQELTDTNNQNYNPNMDFLSELTTILDDAFQGADLSMENVVIDNASGTLVLGTTSLDIATGISNYFASTVLLTGVPQGVCTVTPSAIVSVVNTASTIITPMKTAIEALDTGVEQLPHFKTFVDAVFNAVKTISWTVVESGTSGTPSSPVPCPNTYVVSIS